MIKPTHEGAKIDSSKWPLLLKNYENMNILTSHYTPIPSGSVIISYNQLDTIEKKSCRTLKVWCH